jgi:hypothetical protein
MAFLMIYHSAGPPSRDWIVLAIVACAYYYTGYDGLNMAEDTVGDLL